MNTDERVQRERKIQRTKGYLLDFEKVGFPFEECVACIERSQGDARDYVKYALNDGLSQEELTALLTYYSLFWNDNTWTLNFLGQHLEAFLSKPKMKKSLKGFYNHL